MKRSFSTTIAKSGVYTHGHATPVIQNHAMRTCEDFAPHVVPLLRPGDSILDVGCGPGSITKGFRKYTGPNGRIGKQFILLYLLHL
jgi:hypothetical protein